MQMFVNVGGTPCVIFGPGDVRVAHSADEHVPLAEVEACAQVLAEWVRRELIGDALSARPAVGSAISAKRQNAFASRICSGVRARTRNRSGDATTTLMQRARTWRH